MPHDRRLLSHIVHQTEVILPPYGYCMDYAYSQPVFLCKCSYIWLIFAIAPLMGPFSSRYVRKWAEIVSLYFLT